MGIRDAILAAASDADRATIKEEAIRAFGSIAGQSWTRGRITATVTDGPRIDLGRRIVSVSVRIERDGVDITPPRMNPLEYGPLHRIPMLVPDPAGDVDLGELGTFREDPRAAFLAAVRDTLRGALGG